MLDTATSGRTCSISLLSQTSCSTSNLPLTSASTKVIDSDGTYSAQRGAGFENSVPIFTNDELVVGDTIGRGQFGVVREVINCPSRLSNLARQRRKSLGSDFGNSTRKRRSLLGRITSIPGRMLEGTSDSFVVKQVRKKDFSSKPERFYVASSDLAFEAQMLAKMSHPHIVHLWGTSKPNRSEEDSFLLLERLNGNLEEHIGGWRRKRNSYLSVPKTPISKIGRGNNTQKLSQLEENLVKVALDISDAVKYIHSQGVIHRDLKPGNIGFDTKGRAKLFDFGLAREISPSDSCVDGLYKLTGRVGSMMYMAPEVYGEMPYNETADVYSLSIILWEIFSLERAFSNYKDKRNFVHNVVFLEERPCLDQIKSDSIKTLLRKSWSGNVKERPTSSDVASIVGNEIDGFGVSI